MKEELYQLCLAFVLQRIQTASDALQQAQEASNDDTKSSAGDKFETSREMAQQDINRNKQLLADAHQQLNLLQSIKDVKSTDSVRNGNLVLTNAGNFYISISAGQLRSSDTVYFAISAVAPIAKMFLGKAVNDEVNFNGKKYLIKAIL